MASTADQKKNFGAELRRLRNERGLAAAELAEMLGAATNDGEALSHATVTAWERGVWAPRKPKLLDALEEILDVQDGDLRRRLGYAPVSSNGDGPAEMSDRLTAVEVGLRSLEERVGSTDQKVDEVLRLLRGGG